MTRVNIMLTAQPRAAVTYTCTVYVQLKVVSIQRETVTAQEYGKCSHHSWYHSECTTTVPQLHCLLLIQFSQLQPLPLVSWPQEQVLTVVQSTSWTAPSPPPAMYESVLSGNRHEQYQTQ